jgi:hypothetical protein
VMCLYSREIVERSRIALFENVLDLCRGSSIRPDEIQNGLANSAFAAMQQRLVNSLPPEGRVTHFPLTAL